MFRGLLCLAVACGLLVAPRDARAADSTVPDQPPRVSVTLLGMEDFEDFRFWEGDGELRVDRHRTLTQEQLARVHATAPNGDRLPLIRPERFRWNPADLAHQPISHVYQTFTVTDVGPEGVRIALLSEARYGPSGQLPTPPARSAALRRLRLSEPTRVMPALAGLAGLWVVGVALTIWPWLLARRRARKGLAGAGPRRLGLGFALLPWAAFAVALVTYGVGFWIALSEGHLAKYGKRGVVPMPTLLGLESPERLVFVTGFSLLALLVLTTVVVRARLLSVESAVRKARVRRGAVTGLGVLATVALGVTAWTPTTPGHVHDIAFFTVLGLLLVHELGEVGLWAKVRRHRRRSGAAATPSALELSLMAACPIVTVWLVGTAFAERSGATLNAGLCVQLAYWTSLRGEMLRAYAAVQPGRRTLLPNRWSVIGSLGLFWTLGLLAVAQLQDGWFPPPGALWLSRALTWMLGLAGIAAAVRPGATRSEMMPTRPRTWMGLIGGALAVVGTGALLALPVARGVGFRLEIPLGIGGAGLLSIVTAVVAGQRARSGHADFGAPALLALTTVSAGASEALRIAVLVAQYTRSGMVVAREHADALAYFQASLVAAGLALLYAAAVALTTAPHASRHRVRRTHLVLGAGLLVAALLVRVIEPRPVPAQDLAGIRWLALAPLLVMLLAWLWRPATTRAAFALSAASLVAFDWAGLQVHVVHAISEYRPDVDSLTLHSNVAVQMAAQHRALLRCVLDAAVAGTAWWLWARRIPKPRASATRPRQRLAWAGAAALAALQVSAAYGGVSAALSRAKVARDAFEQAAEWPRVPRAPRLGDYRAAHVVSADGTVHCALPEQPATRVACSELDGGTLIADRNVPMGVLEERLRPDLGALPQVGLLVHTDHPDDHPATHFLLEFFLGASLEPQAASGVGEILLLPFPSQESQLQVRAPVTKYGAYQTHGELVVFGLRDGQPLSPAELARRLCPPDLNHWVGNILILGVRRDETLGAAVDGGSRRTSGRPVSCTSAAACLA